MNSRGFKRIPMENSSLDLISVIQSRNKLAEYINAERKKNKERVSCCKSSVKVKSRGKYGHK